METIGILYVCRFDWTVTEWEQYPKHANISKEPLIHPLGP